MKRIVVDYALPQTALMFTLLLLSAQQIYGQGSPQLESPLQLFENAKPIPLPKWAPPVDNQPNQVTRFDVATQSVSTYDLSEDLSPLPSVGSPGVELPDWAYPGYDIPDAEELLTFTNLSLVTNTNEYPWSASVKLFIEWPNGQIGVCSGALIDPKHVLSAGHCVYSHTNGGWADQIFVYPGYQNQQAAFGGGISASLTSLTGWTVNQDFSFDLSVIELDRHIGGIAGWYGYDQNSNNNFFLNNTFHNPGYPADPPYDGEFMYYWYGDYDLTFNEIVVHYNLGYPGQSGSNSYHIANNDRRTHAVLTHNAAPFINSSIPATGHTRLTQGKVNWINNTIADHISSTPDLLPLTLFGAPGSIPAGNSLSALSVLIHNYSVAAFSGNLQLEVYLSDNEVISTSDTEIFSGSVSGFNLPARGTQEVNFTPNSIQVPSTTPLGNYFIGIRIANSDADNSNNTSPEYYLMPITVTPPPCLAPVGLNATSTGYAHVSLSWDPVQ
ncbi:MAG: trypsin-like serine protease [Phaeodactylibacter sp.]|uniref:trypsin-like serine peptidase n=1 Tax=Phaeodactylibacter sp. TaxID=1940289 RepID=UPI0032EDC1C0